jgi:hypothetical protein
LGDSKIVRLWECKSRVVSEDSLAFGQQARESRQGLGGEGVPPDSAIAQAQRADVGLNELGGGTTLAGAAALLIVGLVVPKRRYRNLSGKN